MPSGEWVETVNGSECDPISFLFEELADLAETLLPHDRDRIGHIKQELERYRAGYWPPKAKEGK